MQDDQQISQSVDNVIAETPDEQSAGTTPSTDYSLGSNPSSSPAIDNSTADDTNNSNSSLNDQAIASDPTTSTIATSPSVDSSSIDQSSDGDSLDQIKQKALSQLTPIISELDQSPEEKYRTLMMLIQASDDKGLIKDAFEAAANIDDKKAKAEALLNIVNEINYFSASHASESDQAS